MGMNETPSGERVHIGFFGRRNAGKSSIVNAVTGQSLAVVSDQKGTTTDPVIKSMELLPIGPVVVTDTPGFDDKGTLGALRIQKTRQVLSSTDIAVLVVDAADGMREADRQLLELFQNRGIPYLVVWNKSDLLKQIPHPRENEIYVSAVQGTNITQLKEKIGKLGESEERKCPLVQDLIHPGDLIVLVIPIDSAAPKGRLILPQQQVIRDVLEGDAAAVCVRETELKPLLDRLGTPPALVITDSQAFERVAAEVPGEIPLTSFSILMARYKGLLDQAVRAIPAIEGLKDGDRILIAEGCTHHRQCDDIGTVKIPGWLKKHTGKSLEIETCSGGEFPEELSGFSLVIHCGGCMLNKRELQSRMKRAVAQGILIINYGIAIAYMKGILKRSIQVFPDLSGVLEKKEGKDDDGKL